MSKGTCTCGCSCHENETSLKLKKIMAELARLDCWRDAMANELKRAARALVVFPPEKSKQGHSQTCPLYGHGQSYGSGEYPCPCGAQEIYDAKRERIASI
jgi:hypothetical protein